MVKKITAVMLCFMIIFSLCAYAETTLDDESTQTIPQTDTPAEISEGGMGGRRGGMNGMGVPPEGFDPSQMPDFPQDGNPEEGTPPFTSGGDGTTDSAATQSGTASDTQQGNEMQMMPDGMMGGRPDGGMGGRGNWTFNANSTAEGESAEITEEPAEEKAEEKLTLKSFITTYQTPIISVVLLAFAFAFVIFYKRKNY